MQVGVKELRNQLSRWLKAARDGKDVVVTDRGRVVARIVGATDTRRLDRLVALGVVQRPSKPRGARTARRVRARSSIAALVDDQRR